MNKKLIAVCGSGLGSSFMLEIAAKDILKKLKIEGVEVMHTSATDVPRGEEYIYICTVDLQSTVEQYGTTIVLNSIMDKENLEIAIKKFIIGE